MTGIGRIAGPAAALAAALLAVQQLGAEGTRPAARAGALAVASAGSSSGGALATARAETRRGTVAAAVAPDPDPAAPAEGMHAGPEPAALEARPSEGPGAGHGAGGSPPLASRIELDPLELEPGSRTVQISGFDPFAARELLLWRLVDGRSAVMARGASVPGGALVFPRVIVPRAGLEVAVAPDGSGPEAPGASLPRRLGAGPPAAPYGEILAAERGEWWLRIRAGESGGEILLAGVDGEIFARHALPPQPAPGGPLFELVVELPASDTHVWLAHALPDGRRSEWRLAAPFPVVVEEVP